MKWTKEQQEKILSDAFGDDNIPKFTEQDINHVYNKCNDRIKRTVVLKVVYNYTYAAIGIQLGCAKSTASQNYRNFLLKIRLASAALQGKHKKNIETKLTCGNSGEIIQDSRTYVSVDSLNDIYMICVDRNKRFGYDLACSECPYRSIRDVGCIFNEKPKNWNIY